ncbi:MAG: hypothetical protein OQL08_03460 [Gammaproteobacteria bacterium]|nr:hypothetical protein [Gammaproteobacteria bacterium]
MLPTKKLLAPLAAIVGLTAVAFEAQATPAFARQMEMNCFACHNQSLPMLNAFGRQFKLSGYTMTAGNKSMITGGDLGTSVPLAVNAGIGIKANNLSTDQTGARDTYSVPAGSAIMISGKAAENMGVNTLWNYDGLIHFQGTYSKPIGAGHIGASLYGTQGHGAFIAVESHNTGLHKELAMFDNSPRTNAAQAVGMGLGKGPSSGLVAFYGGSGLKVALGMQTLGYNTIYGNKGLDTDGSSGSLYRVTYDAPEMAGWNLSVGAFGISGTTTGTTSKMFENITVPFSAAPWYGNVNNHEVTSNGFDLQLQGAIAGMNTQILLTNVGGYEFKIKNEADTMTMVNSDLTATSLEMQIMPTAAWGIRLGQMNVSDNNASANDYTTTSLGVNYNYADNVRFSLEQSSIDVDTGDDYSETLLQALWAF